MPNIIFSFGSGGTRDKEGDSRLNRHHRNMFIRYAINAKSIKTQFQYLAVAFEYSQPDQPKKGTNTDAITDKNTPI